jgi:hypothetical protein
MCDRLHLIKKYKEDKQLMPQKWVVRQEKDGDDLYLVWENEHGDRWYEKIIEKGVVNF